MKKYRYLGLTIGLTLALLVSCAQPGTGDTLPSGENGTEITQTSSKNKVTSTDFLVSQEKTTLLLEAELTEGNYSFQEPFVFVDPYDLSPLSALALFNTEEMATISVEVEGLRGGESFFHHFSEKNTVHAIPIYGLYAEEPTNVILTATFADGTTEITTVSVTGGELPDDLVTYNLDHAQTKAEEVAPGLSFSLRPSRTGYTHAFDANGDVRWIFSDKDFLANNMVIQLENGNLLGASTKHNSTNYGESLFEMDYTGRIYKEYMMNDTHHDMIELPSGNFLVLCADVDGQSIEDAICEIHRETGGIVRFWDLTSYFPVGNRDENGEMIGDVNYATGARDYAHINSIDYREEDQTVIIGSRQQDATFQLNLETGELEWILSNPDDLWTPLSETKLLTPVGEDFEYLYGQHNVRWTPEGDFLAFDNGAWRGKTPETVVPPSEGYSRAVLLSIDEEGKTVEQLWQFGKEFGSENLSTFISNVQYLGEDHYLVNFGGTSFDSDGNVHYLTPGTRKAQFYEVKNDEIIMYGIATSDNTSCSTYQLLRRNIYQNAKQVDLSAKTQQLSQNLAYGVLDSFEVEEVLLETEETFDIVRETITDNGTQLVINITMEGTVEEDVFFIYLVSQAHSYKIPLKSSDSLSYRFNSAEIPQGQYELYLEKNQAIHDLNLYWEPSIGSKEAPTGYEIQISSNIPEGGWTSENLLIYENTAITVEAGPYEGYGFVGWEEDGAIVSEEEKYSFVPTEDVALVAVFE